MKLPFQIAVFATVNIFLGFASNWYTLTFLGPGLETDALYASWIVPNFFLLLVIGSLDKVIVPILAPETDSNKAMLAWTILQAVGIIFLALAGLLFISKSIWVPWIVPGFDGQGESLTRSLISCQLVNMVGNALMACVAAAYYSRKRFLSIEGVSVVSGVVKLASLVWALPRYGVMAAAWTTALRVVFQVVCLLPGLGGYSKINWKHPSLKQSQERLRPLLASTAYFKSDQLLDTYLASHAAPGKLSLYYFAIQLYTYGQQILGKALVTPLVPELARKADEGLWQDYKTMSRQGAGWMLWGTIVAFMFIVLMGEFILNLLFGHRKFDASEVHLLWLVMICMVGYWIGGPVGQVSSYSFYAKGNTLTPTKIGMLGFTLGIGVKIWGFQQWGILGLAGGTSLYYLLNMCLLQWRLQRRLDMRIEEAS